MKENILVNYFVLGPFKLLEPVELGFVGSRVRRVGFVGAGFV